jgi:hypothetical protein
MSHVGSFRGPRFGRGRKHAVQIHWTGTQVVLVLGFLFIVVLLMMVGMYLGWWSLQEEEKTSSPPGQASAIRLLPNTRM